MSMASRVAWHMRRVAGALGLVGGIGALLLLLALVVGCFVLAPIRQQYRDLLSDAQQWRKNARMQVAEIKAKNPLAQVSDLYRFLPPQDTIPDCMEKIYAVALTQGVVLDRGDYQVMDDKDSQLLRYAISLPVKGAYLPIRKFMAEVLNQVPNISLDAVTFNRQRINDPRIDAQLQFVLYVQRTSGTSP